MMLHAQLEPPPVPPSEGKKEDVIESGTVVSWDAQSGTGRVLADKDDQALFVHQCDLTFVGEGKRELPVWHQCEFQRSMVNGSHVAARVSRTHGRPFLFNDPPEEQPQTLPVPNEEKGKVPPLEKLLQYQCRLTTNATFQSGKIYYFHGQFRYGVIIPDHDTDRRVYADASSFEVVGSFLNVRKGLCVEYQTGKNSEGKEVATNITGPGRKPIDHETRVELIVPQKLSAKRRNGGQLKAGKRLKTSAPSKETKPIIPEGKNPISIFYEFANSCNPKRIPSVKLVSQNTRPSGMVSDFTFEARLDDKPIAQGRAKTKKDAKTYAAHYALEVLEKESAVYKQELARIKKGVPSVKKQMRNFTKRRWRPRFTGPTGAPSKFTAAGSSSNILSRSLNNLKQPTTKYDVLTTTPGTSFMYQPTVLVANQIPAVSLTTYNPVNNTTSTSYMNQATAQKFVPAAKPKETTQTYQQPQTQYYAANQATATTAYDANRFAAYSNYNLQAARTQQQPQYAAPTATATTSNPWQNQMTYAAQNAQAYQQKPAATYATQYQRPTGV